MPIRLHTKKVAACGSNMYQSSFHPNILHPRNVPCHETSPATQRSLTWNVPCHAMSPVMKSPLSRNVPCHETSPVKQRPLSWNVPCHETFPVTQRSLSATQEHFKQNKRLDHHVTYKVLYLKQFLTNSECQKCHVTYVVSLYCWIWTAFHGWDITVQL